jgi:putative acetyltransferase
MDIIIRPETEADHAAIHDVTERAFAPMPYSDGDEPHLIGKLRAAGALSLSLVAVRGGIVIGQISFSPAFAADSSPGWFALGPIAVEPKYQSCGVGGRLIRAGITWLREQDAAGCVLVGNPAYYSRFGYRPFPALTPKGEPAESYQILPLRVLEPVVIVGFHPLFHG